MFVGNLLPRANSKAQPKQVRHLKTISWHVIQGRATRTVIERRDALVLDFELQRIAELGWVVQHVHRRDEDRARHRNRRLRSAAPRLCELPGRSSASASWCSCCVC